jgi:uncharacterized membrane protein (DUF2068 family)
LTTQANTRALRVIAIYKFVKAAGLVLLACVAFGLTQGPFLDKVARMVEHLPIQNGRAVLQHWVDQLTDMTPRNFVFVGVAASVYATLFLIEGFGLWTGKRWAEYLTLLVTASLLPVEIYELTDRATPFKAVAFVLNVAVVVYLLYAKRLFGLRGGAAADEALKERDVGWGALEASAPPA